MGSEMNRSRISILLVFLPFILISVQFSYILVPISSLLSCFVRVRVYTRCVLPSVRTHLHDCHFSTLIPCLPVILRPCPSSFLSTFLPVFLHFCLPACLSFFISACLPVLLSVGSCVLFRATCFPLSFAFFPFLCLGFL